MPARINIFFFMLRHNETSVSHWSMNIYHSEGGQECHTHYPLSNFGPRLLFNDVRLPTLTLTKSYNPMTVNRITGVPSTRFMWWRVSYLKTNTSVHIRPLVLWPTLPSLRYTGYLPRIHRIHTRISAMLRAIPQKKGIFNGAARQQGWGDSYVVEVSGDPWTSR